MTHGDDHGLRLPPAIAPQQVVLIPLATGEVARTVDKLAEQLGGEGIRTQVDTRFHLSFGRRSVDWELKGVPVRVELGPRELADGQATLVRRDSRAKTPTPIEGVGRAVRELLDELQRGLHAESLAYREANTFTVADLSELRERVGAGGFFRLAWCGSPACEEALGEGTGASIRAIVEEPAPASACVVDGAPAAHTVLVARAY
jgi:prolyl-tRNA synthetase